MKRTDCILFVLAFLFSSCTVINNTATEQEDGNTLPEGYTIEAIEHSFVEYVNFFREMEREEYIDGGHERNLMTLRSSRSASKLEYMKTNTYAL